MKPASNQNLTASYSDTQKIAAFFAEVDKEFERRDKELTASLEKEKKAALEKAKNKTELEIQNYKLKKISEFMTEISGKTSREILDLKHESLMATENFLNQVKEAVKEKLCAFAETDDVYFEYICKRCRVAYDYVGEGFDLFMSLRDCEKYGDKLRETLDMTFNVCPDESIKIGGVRLCQSDRGISVDETLDEKLEAKINEIAVEGVRGGI